MIAGSVFNKLEKSVKVTGDAYSRDVLAIIFLSIPLLERKSSCFFKLPIKSID